MKRNQNKHKIRKSAVAIMTALSVLMGSACFVMADEPTPAPTTITTPAETPAPVTPAETPAKLPSLSDFLDKELPKLPDDFKPAPVVPGAKEEQLKDQIEKAPDEIIISQLKKKHDNDDSLSREDRIAVESTVDKMTKMPLLDEMEAAMSEMDTAEEMSAYYEKAAADRQAALDAYFAMSEELRKEIPLALVHELQAEMADAWAGKVLEEIAQIALLTAEYTAANPRSNTIEIVSKEVNDIQVVDRGEGYTFLHSVDLASYYQMSPHLFDYQLDGEDKKAAYAVPFVLVNTAEHIQDGTWQSGTGEYDPDSSNYVVTYCCDMFTDTNDELDNGEGNTIGTYYKRWNLEDATYYDDDSAEHIRGIITNAYPFVSANEMRAEMAGELENEINVYGITEGELITATQLAVWHFANKTDTKESLAMSPVYGKTKYETGTDPLAPTDDIDGTNGGVLAPIKTIGYTEDEFTVTDGNAFSDTVNKNITAVYNWLISNTGAGTEDAGDAVVINKVTLETPHHYPIVQKNEDGTYRVVLKVELAGALGENGSGTMTIFTGDEEATNLIQVGEPIDLKNVLGETGKTYTTELNVKEGEYIHVSVSGTQDLPKGVYFYEPYGGRDMAQSFVGVSSGMTPFNAAGKVGFTDPGLDLQIVKTAKNYDGSEDTTSIKNVAFVLSYDDSNDAYDFAGDPADPASPYVFTTDDNGTLTLAGLSGTGTYTLEEVEPAYFKNVLPIQFKVSGGKIEFVDYANETGKPQVTLTEATETAVAKVEIENARFDKGETEIKAIKRLNNRPLAADTKEEFEFVLTQVELDGTVVDTKTITNNGSQVLFELDGLTADGQAEKVLWFELKETDLKQKYYTYDDSVYKIKVVVTPENETAGHNVEVTYYKNGEEVAPEEVAFDNYWKKKKDDNITVTAKKVWAVASDVEIPESVTVELVNEKGNASAGTRVLSEENGWKASWTVDEDETWVVKEVNVPEGFKVSYSGDQEDGFIVTNSGGDGGGKDTSAKVTKKWSGDSEEDRPDSIKVQLYRDGEAYGDIVTLSEADGWSYDWGELDENHEWTVEEIDVPSGYVSKVEGSVEDGFTITNSVSDDDDEEENKNDDGDDDDGDVLGIDDENVPKGDMVLADEEEVLAAETGDNNHIIAAGAAMAAALIGIILLRRKKTN